MEITLHKSGGKADTLKVSEAVFGADYNEALVHQILTSYTAGSRAGTKAQKNRSDVRGGGRKPFRQKGLGRARAGTIRSPIWRGGGVTFAARPRDYSKKVNRKMYRGAMRSIFSELVRSDRLICLEDFNLEDARTKVALAKLKEIDVSEGLIITDEVTREQFLATRNIPRVDIIDTTELDPYSLIGFERVLITKAALEKVEAWLS
ncbi:MAG: 50S ribosomal protein L4 [Gammaproteobacteria bacterium]|nr:50S ribosomal protein L4 [Gammaproteobacteria bacterium]